MSNSVFQSVILQLKEAAGCTFGVIDTDGCVISCTDVMLLGERWPEAALRVAENPTLVQTFDGKTFRGILSSTNSFEYAVFCTGDDQLAQTYCTLAYIALNDAKNFY